jgi:hypothetical protein
MVRKITIIEDTSKLQGETLNLKMVFSHIVLLLAQGLIQYASSTNYFDGSKVHKNYIVQFFCNVALDTIVCCLICSLISDFDFNACYK